MVIFNVHGQGYLHGMRLYIHGMNTPENNQHLKVLIWVGGGGEV